MNGFFRNRWWVVFASASGLLVGAGAINVFAFGVFLKPVSAALGLERGVFSLAIGLSSLLNAIACPVLGWMIDRWGVRRVMIPGVLLCALATASYALMQNGSLGHIYLIFAVAGFVFGVQTPIAYATITAMWFDRTRGIALGLAMAGVGLGVAIIPQIAAALIAHFGWRMAFVGLAACVLIFAFIPITLFFREPPGFVGAAWREKGRAAAEVRGIEIGEALRGSWQFYALTVAFFLAIVAINGTVTHIVALLTDRGLPLQAATGALSASGLAIIFGRILSGWCLDRFWGPYVAAVFFAIPMAGIGLLDSGAGGAVPLLGAALCGLGIGAEVDLMAFFVSRYFGLRDYAKIYGTMFAVFSFGVGVGPAISGQVFDRFHSYDPVFMFYEVLLGITCIVFLRLGPYPFPAQSDVLPVAVEPSVQA